MSDTLCIHCGEGLCTSEGWCASCGAYNKRIDELVDSVNAIARPILIQCLKCSSNPCVCLVTCGCGRHEINVSSDKVAQYKGRLWELRCLFVKIDKRMPKVVKKFEEMERKVADTRKMRLKFIEMKNFIRDLPCNGCGLRAGNRFDQIGDGLYCGKCSRELKERAFL